MEENGKGGGVRWATACCLWFTRLLLFCPPLCFTGRPGCLESPHPPPPPPPPSSPLKSLCYVHSCTVHITSTAPFYSPTATPPPGPAIAEQPPHPPETQQLFPLHACAPRHTSASTGGHTGFSPSPFPFSHIIQFLPLLFTLRKIPWTHDLMKA